MVDTKKIRSVYGQRTKSLNTIDEKNSKKSDSEYVKVNLKKKKINTDSIKLVDDIASQSTVRTTLVGGDDDIRSQVSQATQRSQATIRTKLVGGDDDIRSQATQRSQATIRTKLVGGDEDIRSQATIRTTLVGGDDDIRSQATIRTKLVRGDDDIRSQATQRSQSTIRTKLVGGDDIRSQASQRSQASKASIRSVGAIRTKLLETHQLKDIPTKIVSTQNILSGDLVETKLISTTKSVSTNVIETKIISSISPFTEIELKSDSSKKLIKLYLKDFLKEGSYNKIYEFGHDRKSEEKELIIRIANAETNDIIESEIKGIEIQYELCSKCSNIGIIADYGYVNNTEQNYSILKKYGISISDFLKTEKGLYQNFNIIIDFMKKLLETIQCIHKNNYAHLDLKSCNILLAKDFNITTKISNLDFSVIDFGAAHKFNTDSCKELKEQMASAAFSPPELLNMKFGKKSDIWAYGVICYMMCINKFFFAGGCDKLFIAKSKDKKDIDELQSKLNDHFDNDFKNKLIKNNLSASKITDLCIFFKKIFVTASSKRCNATQLLKEPLFS